MFFPSVAFFWSVDLDKKCTLISKKFEYIHFITHTMPKAHDPLHPEAIPYGTHRQDHQIDDLWIFFIVWVIKWMYSNFMELTWLDLTDVCHLFNVILDGLVILLYSILKWCLVVSLVLRCVPLQAISLSSSWATKQSSNMYNLWISALWGDCLAQVQWFDNNDLLEHQMIY